MIDAYQVDESFVLGADSVLLIVAILPQTTMNALFAGRRSRLGCMDRSSRWVRVSGSAPVRMMLGINNRNLHDFSVDLGTTHRLLIRFLGHAGSD